MLGIFWVERSFYYEAEEVFEAAKYTDDPESFIQKQLKLLGVEYDRHAVCYGGHKTKDEIIELLIEENAANVVNANIATHFAIPYGVER